MFRAHKSEKKNRLNRIFSFAASLAISSKWNRKCAMAGEKKRTKLNLPYSKLANISISALMAATEPYHTTTKTFAKKRRYTHTHT